MPLLERVCNICGLLFRVAQTLVELGAQGTKHGADLEETHGRVESDGGVLCVVLVAVVRIGAVEDGEGKLYDIAEVRVFVTGGRADFGISHFSRRPMTKLLAEVSTASRNSIYFVSEW